MVDVNSQTSMMAFKDNKRLYLARPTPAPHSDAADWRPPTWETESETERPQDSTATARSTTQRLRFSTVSRRPARAASTSMPIHQFIARYCSAPRPAFNRIVVVRYRMHLEFKAGRQHNEPATCGSAQTGPRGRRCRVAESRPGSGNQSRERRKQLGQRSGNWFSIEQSSKY